MVKNPFIFLVSRRAVVGAISAAAALLVATSFGGQVMKAFTGFEKMVWFFNVDAEANLAAWFSSSLLLVAALLLGLVSVLKHAARDSRALQWTGLALMFVFMSIDESSVLHERLEKPTVALLGYQPEGLFHFAWVIPVFAVVAVVALYFWRFFLHLPERMRLQVFVAAALYVGGALGVELLGARHFAAHGATLTYVSIATLEESMEMAGVIVFINALLGYLETHYGTLQIDLTRGREPATNFRRTDGNKAGLPPEQTTSAGGFSPGGMRPT